MSLIRDQLNKKKTRSITLLYNSRTEKDIIFKNELDNIQENWFTKIYILSKEELLGVLYKHGHINKILLKIMLKI